MSMSIIRKIGEGYYALETEDQDVKPGDLKRMTELFEKFCAIPDDDLVLQAFPKLRNQRETFRRGQAH